MLVMMVALLIGAAANALPIDDEAAGDGAKKPDDNGALLAGPKVKEEPGATDNPSFGGDERLRQTVEIPSARWFAALRGLGFTAEEREQVEAVAREYQDVAAAFRKENAAALREMQERIRKLNESGEPDPKLREKYRELRDSAPDAQPYQDRIWQMMNEEQQEAFKVKLEEIRKELAERRAAQREDQINSMRRESRPDDMMAPRRGGGMMDDGPAMDDEMAPRRGDDAARRRGAARGERGMRPGAGLDEMGRKRLEFLMSKQSESSREHGEAADRLRERRQRGAQATDRNPRRERDRQRDNEPDDEPMND